MAKQALPLQSNPNHTRITIPKIGKRKRCAIYIGPPMCGKDTQTEAYELFGIPVFKTGPTLKRLAALEPRDASLKALQENKLVDSSRVNWIVKKWILEHIAEPFIKLNGCPRKPDQLPIVGFLRERGFDPIVVWFMTSVEALMSRPVRLGRENEDTAEDRTERIATYRRDTLPMMDLLESNGIAESYGNLLFVDNSNLQKRETGKLILDFLQLPLQIDQLFPATMVEIPQLHENRQTAVA